MKKWNCEFKKDPKKITVGTKLQLSCDGNVPASLSAEKLNIIFPKKEDTYKLHVLKTLHVEGGHIDLEVASYRPGPFKGSFTITDGSRSFVVEDFSFHVDSVLSKNQQTKAHVSFGPWKESLSVPYFLFSGLTIALFLAIIILLFSRYFRRKKLTEIITKRLANRLPSKVFIKNLRRFNKNSLNYISDLEVLFQTFLENLFHIPVLKKKPLKFLYDLKKYENFIYKKYFYKIRQTLNELSNFRRQKNREEVNFQLEKTCKELVFLLEKEKKQ